MSGLWVDNVVVEIAGPRPRDTPHRVLDGLSVEVPAGAVLVLAGSPRFGGTTVARVIAGLVAPNAGTVEAGGRDLTAVPPGRRPVALVPAGGGLFPHLTASENIVYGLRLRNEASVLIRTRVADVVARLELDSSLDLRPHELSPGQRLRTALARAVVRTAPVLVVDATAGADTVDLIRPMIERIQRDDRLTVLLCTNRPDLMAPADPVVLVAAGRAVHRGTLAELRGAPLSPELARLVRGDRAPGDPVPGHEVRR